MIGVVLAGGASTRFGGTPKGLTLLNGRAMALRVADVLASQCDTVMIEAPRGAGYEALGFEVIHAASEHVGKGPLAALVAGLLHAPAHERVAFAPCDMPLLTSSIYQSLRSAGGVGAYAQTPAGVEPLVAVLKAELTAKLLDALKSETLPRTHSVLDQVGVQAIDFADLAAFANVNTPDDLARIEARFGA